MGYTTRFGGDEKPIETFRHKTLRKQTKGETCM
jgi:hypothetical protein